MKRVALSTLVVLALIGGTVAAIAVGAGETTGTNVACATVSTPDHTLGVDSTAVYTITGTTTSSCTTATYTIPTSTTTTTTTATSTQTVTQSSSTSTTPASTSTSTTPTSTSTSTSSSSTTPAPAPSAFVTRTGQQLLLGGMAYHFTGFNMWRANITSWNQPPNENFYFLNAGAALDTSLKNISAGGSKLNVMRTWFFQQFALHDGAATGVYDWSAFDKTLQVAQANGFKVIATLADQWSYETDDTSNGIGWLPYTWYQTGYKTGPFTYLEHYSYRQYVHDVVTRYKDNPTILGWELVNEPEVASSDGVPYSSESVSAGIMAAFVHDVGGLIKSIDPNHLVSLGASGNGMPGTLGGDYQTVMGDSSIDLCSFHDYYGYGNISAYNQWNGLNTRIPQCAAINKPIYIGEMGLRSNSSPCSTPTCRAGYLGQKLASAFGDQGMVGYLPWQYDDRGLSATGDGYVYGPGDPGLPVLSSYALP